MPDAFRSSPGFTTPWRAASWVSSVPSGRAQPCSRSGSLLESALMSMAPSATRRRLGTRSTTSPPRSWSFLTRPSNRAGGTAAPHHCRSPAQPRGDRHQRDLHVGRAGVSADQRPRPSGGRSRRYPAAPDGRQSVQLLPDPRGPAPLSRSATPSISRPRSWPGTCRPGSRQRARRYGLKIRESFW
jgi:hypothetical protein